MQLTEQQTLDSDNKIITELRAMYKAMSKEVARLTIENENLKKQLYVIREKAKAVHDAVTELDSEVNL